MAQHQAAIDWPMRSTTWRVADQHHRPDQTGGQEEHDQLRVYCRSLSAAYDQPVTMSFLTFNGTVTTGDKNFVVRSGILTFTPEETTKTVIIEVVDDNRRESDEVYCLDLSGNSINSLFTKNLGIGTILNDD